LSLDDTVNDQISDIFRESAKTVVQDAVLSLVEAAKLSLRDAKTCIYWRLGAVYLEKLNFYPVLALVGPAGSGKNTIMKALKSMPGGCSDITDCGLLTPAATRDELAANHNLTFFADEFDDIKPEVGRLFMSRTTREMSNQTFKKLYKPGDYRQALVNIFGATVIHKRNKIQEPAMASRSIQITTHYVDGPYGTFKIDYSSLESLYIDMTNVKEDGGRIESTWAPVLEVARQLGDISYLDLFDTERAAATKSLRQRSEYDNNSIVLAKVVEVLMAKSINRWSRIDIEDSIGRSLRVDYPYLVPIVVNGVLEDLGFFTERSGGRRWLYPEFEAIKLASQKCYYKDTDIDMLDT
jgi:hypothetical protein